MSASTGIGRRRDGPHENGEGDVMSQALFTWFAGVDWGSEGHQVCVVDIEGNIAGERKFPHSGAGLAELGDWLLSIAGAAGTVVVAIEVPHGPVVDTLIDRGFVVHAINPKQLDRLRDRFSVAGAKDDRRDAYVLGDGVRTDRRLFRRLHVADPRLIELRAWSRLAEELKQERVRLTSRIQHELWRYYPAMQKLTNDFAEPWFLELWTAAPTPAKARQLRGSWVEQLLKRHRIRRIEAEAILRILREPAIRVADGVAEAASIHMRSLIARLRVVNREIRDAEGALDKICAAIGDSPAKSGDGLQRQDIMILKSMPGIGRINLAALISEGSGPLSTRDYSALRTLSGAAPVTKRSGKSHIVIMRYAAHVRLRNTIYHWARVAIQHDPKSRSRYVSLRQRGKSHGRALRGVADRLLALACVLLQRQTPFDPQFGQTAT